MSFEQTINEIFSELDLDKNGKITRSEAEHHYFLVNLRFGTSIGQKEINELFESCDQNGDGVIDASEYQKAFLQKLTN